MENVTETLRPIDKVVLFQNCGGGIMIGGHCGEGKTFYRRFKSNTMINKEYPNQIFVRTGEIMMDEKDYYIVFRLNDDADFVISRYPDAYAKYEGVEFRIETPLLKQRLSGFFKTSNEAWADARKKRESIESKTKNIIERRLNDSL